MAITTNKRRLITESSKTSLGSSLIFLFLLLFSGLKLFGCRRGSSRTYREEKIDKDRAIILICEKIESYLEGVQSLSPRSRLFTACRANICATELQQ